MKKIKCIAENGFIGSFHPKYGEIKKDEIYEIDESFDFENNTIFIPIEDVKEKLTSAQAVKATKRKKY